MTADHALTRDCVVCPHSSTHSKINYASLDIKEKIGEGSFSVVYKGIYNNEEVTHAHHHTHSNRTRTCGVVTADCFIVQVAIKRLKFNDEKIRENRLLKAFDEFRNEVFLMRYLNSNATQDLCRISDPCWVFTMCA